MKTAITTICVGDEHRALWERHGAPHWSAYAAFHGYALHVIDRPIDTSPRAAARSPAWQKCIILRDPALRNFDRVVWVDADIVPANGAPSVCDGVPPGKIGATISGGHLDAASRVLFLQRWNGHTSPHHVDAAQAWALDQRRWYQIAHVQCRRDEVLQTGVLVLEHTHRDLLERVYAVDLPPSSILPYEQTHLSAEIINCGLDHILDPRFNWVAFERFVAGAPYLLNPEFPNFEHLARLAVKVECANGFFVHFAYQRKFMDYLRPEYLFG